MTTRVEVKIYRSIGQHPLYLDETKDWALTTFDKKLREIEKNVKSSPYSYSSQMRIRTTDTFLKAYTTYYAGCPNNLAYHIVKVYESNNPSNAIIATD